MCGFDTECVAIVANVRFFLRFFLIVATIVTHLRQNHTQCRTVRNRTYTVSLYNYNQVIPKLFWSKGKMAISTPTPFSIVETRTLDCQFGPHYYKEELEGIYSRQSQNRMLGTLNNKKCIQSFEIELERRLIGYVG